MLAQCALILGVFLRVCDDEPLFQFLLVYPALFIEYSVAHLVELFGKKCHGVVLSADVPSFRVKGPLLEMLRYLIVFQGLDCDEVSPLTVVVAAV